MRRVIDNTLRVGATLLTVAILLINLRLYSSSTNHGPNQVDADIVAQLRFISAVLRDGAGERMQILFPEGFFFTHVLYGLAWVEVGLRQPVGTPLHIQALREARWALLRLDSPTGQAPFTPTLDPPLGVFYVGWSSWLQGGILKLQPAGGRNPDEVARFQADCTALVRAFERSPTPFLNAYPKQAWPVDSVVAIAALRLHDSLLPSRFNEMTERWLEAAQTRLDPATGLIPHRVDPQTGYALEGARGSSQSIIARFLVEIDPVWGREQYFLFRQQFITTLLGMPASREYPHGVNGLSDVDSGPLVAGVSASATVVTLGAALVHGDRTLAEPLIQAGETTGIPISWHNTKRYALGILPVGDAFLVWAKTARPWIVPPATTSLPPVVGRWWRWPNHILSLVIIALIWLPVWRRRR